MMRRLTPVFVTAVFVLGTACGWPLGQRPFRPFFEGFRAAGANVRPPDRGLELWLEGEMLTPDGSGRVPRWPDMRGTREARAWVQRNGSVMDGTVATATVRNPAGQSRVVRGLRCASSPRCSYALAVAAGGPPRRDVLTGRPYAILAVVRRAGSRGDNYVVMTDGTGCAPLAGGTGCTGNTALHLGWSGNETLRLGQYDNDVTVPVHGFNAPSPLLSLLAGVSNSGGKAVGILEPVMNRRGDASDTRPLDRSGTLFVGGTPWADGNPVPDWRFEGDIFAVLVYSVEITADELRTAGDYLRTRYGPA